MNTSLDRRHDVFLCYNTINKPQIRLIAKQLQEYDVVPWFGEWNARPGFSWQSLVEEQIVQVKSAAVFVGEDGIGPWQQMEIESLLQEFVYRQCPVIPVILANAKQTPKLPPFLGGIVWVDFRCLSPDPMQQLLLGITGNRPTAHIKSKAPPNVVPALDEQYDVFLSYAEVDAEWVEAIANALKDQVGFRVWLDKWEEVPGLSKQQTLARGIDHTRSHVVCIGAYNPGGWFQLQIERALDRQAIEPSLRVIPVLLPGAQDAYLNTFLGLNIHVDFRYTELSHAFHLLVCGIKGIAPGRWPPR